MIAPSGNRVKSSGVADGVEWCLVLHPNLKTEHSGARAPAARLEEALGLARGISLEIAHSEVINVPRVRPATLFRSGIDWMLASF